MLSSFSERICPASVTHASSSGGTRMRDIMNGPPSGPQQHSSGETVLSREFTAADLLAVAATRAQHLDGATLGRYTEASVRYSRYLADLPADVSKAPIRVLACVEDLDLLPA